MSRNSRTEGIVLKNNRFGEIHKGVVFLSPDQGLVSAVAYGAYSARGKLRSITNPLCAGTFFLYRDPVKDSVKITDLDCREFFEGVRGKLGKFFTASVWMETVLKTFGGDSEEVFGLLLEGLRLLDGLPEDRVPKLLVQFLHRYLRAAGIFPGLGECGRCGRQPEAGEGLVHFRGTQGFLCRDCSGPVQEEEEILSAGALKYLDHTLRLDLAAASAVELDPASFSSLKRTVLSLTEDLAGSPLNSIRTGAGVL